MIKTGQKQVKKKSCTSVILPVTIGAVTQRGREVELIMCSALTARELLRMQLDQLELIHKTIG
jgi:hypothetical protein